MVAALIIGWSATAKGYGTQTSFEFAFVVANNLLAIYWVHACKVVPWTRRATGAGHLLNMRVGVGGGG